MAGQTLTTTILINAKASGFAEVGNTLMELGAMANGVSQQLIDFGKDSIEVYRDYDKSMHEAEVALATAYGRDSSRLSAVMKGLDEQATEWAATSIFHTDDVANAIAEAARAGWDYDMIMSGIPASMKLAQAGSIDLSEAVNYITTSAKAAGIEFQDLGTFIDEWVFAANSSNATVETFGDTMQRMGSTMRFTDSIEELMTLIAVTANAGSAGAEAGTMIRNSILRLAAPTDKARQLMDQLGASADEANEIFADESLVAANQRLVDFGFSIYDQDGQLKSVLDTYRELYLALGEISGGFENIEKNEDSINILKSIFGQRAMTEGLNLLRSAAEDYGGLYEQLMNGEAEGYASWAQETMWESLDDRIEAFESKVERLKQAVGEELAPQLEAVMESVGGVVDSIAGMDEVSFGALVSGLESIAFAGPGLIMAGIGLKTISSIMTGGPLIQGGLALAAGITGYLTIVSALEKIKDINFEENFGNLSLNMSEVQSFVSGLSADFEAAQSKVAEFETALNTALETYQSSSSELKENLLTSMLTGMELSDTDVANLNSLGESMIASLKDGIESKHGQVTESIMTAFSGDEDNPVLSQIMSVLEEGYAQDIARAEELSQQLRDAMTSAFADGTLSQEEVANMQSIIDQQNQLMAEQADREHALERERILRKAQTLGLDAITESAELTREARDAEMETLLDRQAAARYDTAAWYDKAIENGWEVDNTDGTSGTHVATATDKEAALRALDANQRSEYGRWRTGWDDFILGTMLEGIQESDLSGAWSTLAATGSSFRQSGGILTSADATAFNTAVDGGTAQELSRYLNMMVDNLGGFETIAQDMEYYRGIGDEQSAGVYQQIMDMYSVLGGGINGFVEAGTVGAGDYSGTAGTYDQVAKVLQDAGTIITPEGLVEVMHDSLDSAGWYDLLGTEVASALTQSAINAGFEGTNEDVITQMVSDLEANMPPVRAEVELEETDLTQSADIEPLQVPVEPQLEDAALAEQDVNVPVDADTAAASGAIDELDGQNLTENVDGDTSALSSAIDAQDNRQLTAYVNGNTSALASAINALNGRTITVNIARRQLFAEGGRATTASIFGEAGPEWAIPEEHSQRTAELLDAARAASGFTWPDLLSRLGGMNSDASASPTTIVYSPTINANDASGVEAALREDKFRLERWFEERQMRDRMEVYA